MACIIKDSAFANPKLTVYNGTNVLTAPNTIDATIMIIPLFNNSLFLKIAQKQLQR